MAMLSGYFDAAGDNSAEHAITVGGYVAPVRSWSRFRRDWRRVLDRHGIDVFHMTDFTAGQSPFEEWRGREDAQMRVLEQLAKVIGAHAHYSLSTTVLLDDWRAINRDYRLKECRATPYALAAFSVINKSIQWIKRQHPHDPLKEFVFEAGDVGYGDLLSWMDWVREVAPRGSLDSVYPVARPKSLEPLQAADFAAWEQRHAAVNRARNEEWDFRASMAALLRVPHDWGMTRQDSLTEICERFGIPQRDPSQRPSQREVSKWRPAPLAKLKQKRKAGG